MSLPKLKVKLMLRDPSWTPIFEDGNPWAVNKDSYLIEQEREVEVVQLNLNTGGMRIRWNEPDATKKKGYVVESCDISIDHFYKHYHIIQMPERT
jgi:hypothetical protein